MLRLLAFLLLGIPLRQHQHDDEVIETVVIDSPYDKLKGAYTSLNGIGNWWFCGTVLTVVRCKTCGNVRHIRSNTVEELTHNPDFKIENDREKSKKTKKAQDATDDPADN